MCPSYRVTRDEEHVTRGRANTLRLALTGQLGPGRDGFGCGGSGNGALRILQGCRRECPTGVDMAKMKIEVLAARVERHGLSRRDGLIAGLPRVAPIASRMRMVTNARNRSLMLRRLGERWLGLAAERPLPVWDPTPFRDSELKPATSSPPATVFLFADTFNRWFEPENLRAAIRVLTAAGYRPTIPPASGRPFCCGRTYLAAGLVDQARTEARRDDCSLRWRSAGDRAGTVLPAHSARRIPCSAARGGNTRSRRPGHAAIGILQPRESGTRASSHARHRPCARALPPEGIRRLPGCFGFASPHPGTERASHRVLLLRHGGRLRLSGGNPQRLESNGRSLPAAGLYAPPCQTR